MIIDGIDLMKFNTSVQKKLLNPYNKGVSYEKMGLSFIRTSKERALKIVSIELKVRGNDRTDVYMNASNVIAMLGENNFKFKNLPFLFHGVLEGDPKLSETEFDDLLIMSIEFVCYQYGEEVIEEMNYMLEKSIVVKGNMETPVVYEITPIATVISFKINDITVKNVEMNKTLIINGEDCTITMDGKSDFENAELTSFPTLNSGINTIKVNTNKCKVKIKYKPRFA